MSVTDLKTARRALYEARIKAADFSSPTDQEQLNMTLKQEVDTDLQIMVIDAINPDLCWQTLVVLASKGPVRVASAAASRLQAMKDEPNMLYACSIVASESYLLTIRAKMADYQAKPRLTAVR